MKSFKLRMSFIAALSVAFALTLGIFLSNIFTAKAERYVTISGTSIFYTSGGAEIWAHKIENGEGAEDDEYYSLFSFGEDGDGISYRRTLAYKWIYNADDKEDYADGAADAEANPTAAEGYLTLEIGFTSLDFDKFTITFESQQYNATKDGKSVNYVVLVPDGEKLSVKITDDKEVAEGETEFEENEKAKLSGDRIKIQLSGGECGEYGVTVSNPVTSGEAPSVSGTFKNVGKTYARYVSSSTDPVTPLSFSADVKEAEDGASPRARMVLYSLNGQSFKLSDTSTRPISSVAGEDGTPDHYTGGQVNDTTPPVLCLTDGLTFIKTGGEITFSTQVIDVLTQSPSTETGYYILKTSQAEDDGFKADNYKDSSLFKVVHDSDDQYMIPHSYDYVPDIVADAKAGVFDEEDFAPVAAVKVYVKLTDTSSSGGQSTFVMLDWFIDEDYLLTINGNKYIAIAEDKVGASYNYGGYTDKAGNTTSWGNLVEEYQAQVTEAAKDLVAGSENKMYLPSAEKLFSDNATAYTDMKYSIYFNNGSQQSDTGNSSSDLSINLGTASTYIFTIYATDAAGNDMWYMDGSEKKTFSSGEVWTMYADEDDEGLRDKLPWFTFEVEASEISVEDPGAQDTAYVGSQYSASSFKINGVSYADKYTLYLFNNDLYYEETGAVLNYDDFMAQKEDLFENHRNYFTLIRDLTDLDENEEDYETQSAYAWTSSSRTFTPQDANSFYLIKCEVTSTQDAREAETAYMGIIASVRPRAIAGENTWLADNLTSVILLSIAGASLIGIILLLVIRPRNKGDIDEQFEEDKKKKSKK